MSDASNLDYVRDLAGFKRGHPHYYKDPIIDHLLEIVLQLGAEIWVNRDRQMVMEHLLETEGKVTTEMIEQFRPSPELNEQLREARNRFTQRVYSCLYEGFETKDKSAFVPGVIKTESKET